MTGHVGTATVETLTAEVRVLMVGSRQVTLSVFRQLDSVRQAGDLEPFGRVRDGERQWLIGRRKWASDLVRYPIVLPSWAVRTREDNWSMSDDEVAQWYRWRHSQRLSIPPRDDHWRDYAESDSQEVFNTDGAALDMPLIVLAGLK